MRKAGRARRSRRKQLMTMLHLRSSTNSTRYKVKKLTMQRKTGQMKRQNYFSGLFKSTVKVRDSLLKNLIRMTGYKLLGSFPAEMTHSVSISSTRIRNQPFKRATGSKEKTRNLSDSLESMEPSNGVKLPLNSMKVFK